MANLYTKEENIVKGQEPASYNGLQTTQVRISFSFNKEKLSHYNIAKMNSNEALLQEHLVVIREIENGYLVENKIYTQINHNIKETYYRNYPTHIEKELLELIATFLLK
jgi:hypothetical protein